MGTNLHSDANTVLESRLKQKKHNILLHPKLNL